MVLSEAEAEARLTALRREREALDRAITDLTLYLELGRRLNQAAPDPAADAAGTGDGPAAGSSPEAGRGLAAPDSGYAGPAGGGPLAREALSHGPTASAAPRAAAADPGPGWAARAESGPAAQGEAESAGGLSEGVVARRYGRALIEAALAALEEAGRPLHASEILAVLDARGFALPGRDPVAALNTRLWKRAGPGGPLRRLGEAVYALAEEPEN